MDKLVDAAEPTASRLDVVCVPIDVTAGCTSTSIAAASASSSSSSVDAAEATDLGREFRDAFDVMTLELCRVRRAVFFFLPLLFDFCVGVFFLTEITATGTQRRFACGAPWQWLRSSLHRWQCVGVRFREERRSATAGGPTAAAAGRDEDRGRLFAALDDIVRYSFTVAKQDTNNDVA